MRLTLLAVYPILLFVLPTQSSVAQKKDDKKDQPRAIVAVPLSAQAGATSKLFVRGLKIDEAKEIKFAGDKQPGSWKLVKKTKVPVPNNADPNKLGDSQIDVELTLPAGLPAGEVAFVIVTDKGVTEPHKLLVGSPHPLIQEKEGNNGFRAAQPVQAPQVVEGSIQGAQDVDVFKIEGKAGQTLVFEVLAARLGSPLDPIITLYDDKGQALARSDDELPPDDPRLEVKLPRDGVYYLSLIDAHDQGGLSHVYRLIIEMKK